MKKIVSFVAALLIMASGFLAVTVSAENAQDRDRPYRVSKIIGLWVTNHEGKYFGRIQDLVFDREGHVIFAIVGYSKFNWKLIDENSVAVPFKLLNYEWNTKHPMAVTDITWDKFKSARDFANTDLMNRQKEAAIYHYFGQQPHWTELHLK